MDAKKHPLKQYENPVTHERLPARNVESSDDENEPEFDVFVR